MSTDRHVTRPVYVRNCWYVAAWAHELDSEALFTCTVLNEPLVLYRQQGGGITALQDRCPHRAAPLSMGRREGDDLRCGYHGFKFDARGACLHIPGKARVPVGVRARAYAAVEKNSWVWVWMGDPAAADAALIPETIALDHPAWALRHGDVSYQAHYQLVNDNLTDLSHLSFVHAKSFGAGEEWGATPPKVEELARGVRISRWLDVKAPRPHPAMPDMPPPPPFQTWSTYDYLVPGILVMRTANFMPGTIEATGGKPPPDDCVPFFDSCAAQAVTASTDRSTRYFFSVGVRAGEPASEMMADMGLKLARQAFEEDRLIIEAQQRSIDLTGDHMLLAGADLAPITMRGLIERLAPTETP